MGESSWRGLYSLLGIAAVVLGLIGLWVQAQAFFGIYSEPVKLLNSYIDLVPLFSFIVGLALILGANVAKGKRSRIILLVATVTLLGFFTFEASLAISAPVYDAFPPTLSIVSSSIICSTGTHTCTMEVINTGPGEGTIIGAGPSSGTITFSAPQSSIPPGNSPTPMTITLGGTVTVGQTISGYLVMSDGPNLYFTAVLR